MSSPSITTGYSTRIVEAVQLAHELHQTQSRKGTSVPYITHLFGVAALVGQYGGTEDQFIAALLHDAAEDQGGDTTLRRIEAQFGAPVARIVAACSDTMDAEKPEWRPRKEAHLAKMRTLPPEPRLILAADKVYNCLMTLDDVGRVGPEFLERFSGGRAGVVWYYGAAHKALSDGWEHPLLDVLARAAVALSEIG